MSRADFDLHGVVRMPSPRRRRRAQLRDMFARFLVDEVADPNLTVDDRLVETPRRGPAPTTATATRRRRTAPRGPEGPGRRARATGFRVHGAGELLHDGPAARRPRRGPRRARPWSTPRRSSTTGDGVLLAGTGGAGKTSTVAKLVQGGDTRPWATTGPSSRGDGRLLGFAKPLLVRAPPPQPVPASLQAGREEEADDPARAGRPHGPPGHGGAPDDRPLSARRARRSGAGRPST